MAGAFIGCIQERGRALVSIEAIQWALDLKHANPTHKAVLIGLANHADPDGTSCHPSLDRLEIYTGLGRSTIIRAIRQMEELGILRTEKAHGKRTDYYLDTTLKVVPQRHQLDQCRNGTSAATVLVPQRSKVVPQRYETSAAAALKPSGTVSNRQLKGEARGSRLPPDWQLPSDWWSWSASEGLDADTIDTEASKFRDYWIAKAGKDAAKADWQATWRNWCRRVLEDNRRRGPPKTAGRSALMDEILRQANDPTH